MPTFEPLMLIAPPEQDGTSMAWTCTACGRIYLYELSVDKPEACIDCEAVAQQRAVQTQF
jgi:hypothetical protein